MVLAENARRCFCILAVCASALPAVSGQSSSRSGQSYVPAGASPLGCQPAERQAGSPRSSVPAGGSPLSKTSVQYQNRPLRTFISQAPAGHPAGAAACGAAPAYSAPVPGNASLVLPPAQPLVPGTTRSSAYSKLPLNPGNAAARLEELRNLMPNSRLQDFQEAIGEYCEWLQDVADAHWKLSQTFAKVDTAKAQAESEKQMCLKFGGLRRQAMLLKAEFLISQRRYPEALQPLVDIVSAEPKTETGQNAYRLLQEIGFSEQVQAAGKPALSTN